MDRRTWLFIIAGLAVTILVAAVASGFASSEPDGLEKVSIEEGFDETAEEHALADSPLADYAVEGVDNERVSTGLAGVVGVIITLLLMTGLLLGVSRLRRSRADTG
jgi:hypothetical protein